MSVLLAIQHKVKDMKNQTKQQTDRSGKVSNFGASVGQPPVDKSNGIKIRGTGAATKGLRARGPMA